MLARHTRSLTFRLAANPLRRPVRLSSSFKTAWYRQLSSSAKSASIDLPATSVAETPKASGIKSHSKHAHAVLSTFDLFSIGVGPSSSHTVGPWRAAGIFTGELERNKILDQVASLKITLYGSLAATGKGHYTVEGLLMGMQGYDCETCDTSMIQPNYKSIVDTKAISLAGHKSVRFDPEKDISWRWDAVLPEHPNGMTFTVFDKNGDLLALNEYFSVGGGFVVTPRSLQVGGENVFYKEKDHLNANPARRQQNQGVPSETAGLLEAPTAETKTEQEPSQSTSEDRWARPPMPFSTGADLLNLCDENNLSIAQVVWENERHYMMDDEIRDKLLNIWKVMDSCIREGVTSQETHLPGGLNVKRRAPALYKRLMRGLYRQFPEGTLSSSKPLASGKGDGLVPLRPGMTFRGRRDHPLPPVPPRKTSFPAMEALSTYAMAVNEVNAAGGRIVTAPTNGASGILPSVGKYLTEFVSSDPETDILTFLLTGSAVGMLIKRGASISGAEGGCMAEVGSATAMAAAGFTAVCGGTPAQILQAAEVSLEHSLGLTCDPIGGLVQAPCIERNSLGAIKAVAAAQLALSGNGEHLISLDEVITTMRNTAQDMHVHYKETSIGGLAATIKIPVSMPDC